MAPEVGIIDNDIEGGIPVGFQPQPHCKGNAMNTELGKMKTGLFVGVAIVEIRITRESQSTGLDTWNLLNESRTFNRPYESTRHLVWIYHVQRQTNIWVAWNQSI